MRIGDSVHISISVIPRSASGEESAWSLAPTYCGDDLDSVAGGKPRFAMAAFRHDLAVAFHGDTLPLQGELAHEIGDGQRIVAAMRRAVEDDRQHGETTAKR